MIMTPQQLWDAAITLENDGEFYKEYTNYESAGTPTADGRRSIISRTLIRLGIPPGEVEDREQLRRYLDNSWQLSPATHRTNEVSQTAAELDTIEFWKDEVRFPKKEATPMPAAQAPQPGSVWWKHRNWEGCNPPNHGEYYASADIGKMVTMFYNGCDAPTIAHVLRRKHNGIASKLKELRLLTFDSLTNTWHVVLNLPSPEAALSRWSSPLSSGEQKPLRSHVATTFDEFYDKAFNGDKGDVFTQPTHLSEQTLAAINSKETIMTAPIIEVTTKTLINGIDIATMADSVIYSTIANQEAEIEKLEKIKNKPKRLVAEIEKRQAGIAALVAHLDSKEDKTA